MAQLSSLKHKHSAPRETFCTEQRHRKEWPNFILHSNNYVQLKPHTESSLPHLDLVINTQVQCLDQLSCYAWWDWISKDLITRKALSARPRCRTVRFSACVGWWQNLHLPSSPSTKSKLPWDQLVNVRSDKHFKTFPKRKCHKCLMTIFGDN